MAHKYQHLFFTVGIILKVLSFETFGNEPFCLLIIPFQIKKQIIEYFLLTSSQEMIGDSKYYSKLYCEAKPIRNVELEINREKPGYKRPEALSYVNVVDNNSYTKQKLIIMEARKQQIMVIKMPVSGLWWNSQVTDRPRWKEAVRSV